MSHLHFAVNDAWSCITRTNPTLGIWCGTTSTDPVPAPFPSNYTSQVVLILKCLLEHRSKKGFSGLYFGDGCWRRQTSNTSTKGQAPNWASYIRSAVILQLSEGNRKRWRNAERDLHSQDPTWHQLAARNLRVPDLCMQWDGHRCTTSSSPGSWAATMGSEQTMLYLKSLWPLPRLHFWKITLKSLWWLNISLFPSLCGDRKVIPAIEHKSLPTPSTCSKKCLPLNNYFLIWNKKNLEVSRSSDAYTLPSSWMKPLTVRLLKLVLSHWSSFMAIMCFASPGNATRINNSFSLEMDAHLCKALGFQ